MSDHGGVSNMRGTVFPTFAAVVLLVSAPGGDLGAEGGPRFRILAPFNNEAVLDRSSGLLWERAPSVEQHSWYAASEHCFGKAVGGRKGWRLASAQELTDLSASLTGAHPFVNVNYGFWSASSVIAWRGTVYDGINAVSVSMPQGDVLSSDYHTNRLRAWCVRGGLGPNGLLLGPRPR